MPQCPHPIAYLHTQLLRNPQTAAPEYHLVCDRCGKDIPLEMSQVFLWMKILELRDLIAGVVAASQTIEQRRQDVFGGA